MTNELWAILIGGGAGVVCYWVGYYHAQSYRRQMERARKRIMEAGGWGTCEKCGAPIIPEVKP